MWLLHWLYSLWLHLWISLRRHSLWCSSHWNLLRITSGLHVWIIRWWHLTSIILWWKHLAKLSRLLLGWHLSELSDSGLPLRLLLLPRMYLRATRRLRIWLINLRLINKNSRWIIWIKKCEIVLKILTLELSNQCFLCSKIRLLTILLLPLTIGTNLEKCYPPSFEETHATSLHKPHLELRIRWQTPWVKRLNCPLNIISSKNWLFKTFFKHQTKR